MMIFETQERIEAPAGVVWQSFSDPRRMAAWMPGIDAMRTSDGAALAAGSALVFDARGGQKTSEVVAFEPARLIALRSSQGPFTATYRYELAPVADHAEATVVRLRADCEARGPAKMIAPLVRAMIRKADLGQLAHLKAAVEQEA